MIINGYKYDNEIDAIKARKDCSDYYGLPKSDTDVTIYWINYNYADLNNPQFYYIIYDDSILDILGQPSQFDVEIPINPIIP